MSYVAMNGLGRALGIASPTGQSWNTPTYNACMGYRVQQCGSQGYQAGWSNAQVTDCIDTAQQECIAQAKAALTSVLTTSQIKAIQSAINAALKTHGYCPIGVDGKLGPTTCGAAAWAAGIGAPVSVPGPCGKTVPMGTGFLKDCAPTALPSMPPPPPAVIPKPVLPAPPTVPAYQPPPAKKANILVVGAVATMVAGGGYLLFKKKGWIK